MPSLTMTCWSTNFPLMTENKQCQFAMLMPQMMDATITEEEDTLTEFWKRARVPLISQEEMDARGMEPDHMHGTMFPLDTLFCKLIHHRVGIRLQFLQGDTGVKKVTLKEIKTALRAAMEHFDGDGFALTFKRGDEFMVPHEANNEDFVGDQDCCHVVMTVDQLNKLKQVSLGRTAGVCWK